jgi:hypothetical protein
MTFHTGTGNIIDGDTGVRAGVGKHQVVSMAIVTGGRHDQTFLEKSVPMDALAVVFQDIVLGDVIDPGYWCTFPVAFATQDRNVHFIGPGAGI